MPYPCLARAAWPGLLAVSLLAACGREPLPMDRTRLTDLATRYTEAWNGSDPSRVAGYFALDGSLIINDRPPLVGRDSIAAAVERLMRGFPDVRFTLDSVLLEGDSARYHWTLTGTNSGPGGTGRPVQISGHAEWTFAEGDLIATSHGHFDAGEFARQVGN